VDSVENDEEAVRRINGTEYGLIGGVFCEDKERVDKMVSEINAGTVLVNSIYSPDGRLAMSGRKSSGRNVLYSGLSYRHFYRTKSVQARFNL
jgi:acyl-CoA reductase-like NAD-dependent aldehyde dehydrogenase